MCEYIQSGSIALIMYARYTIHQVYVSVDCTEKVLLKWVKIQPYVTCKHGGFLCVCVCVCVCVKLPYESVRTRTVRERKHELAQENEELEDSGSCWKTIQTWLPAHLWNKREPAA